MSAFPQRDGATMARNKCGCSGTSQTTPTTPTDEEFDNGRPFCKSCDGSGCGDCGRSPSPQTGCSECDEPTCPDLDTLCPADGLFFEIVNNFGTDAFTGAPQAVVIDCNACLTDEQLANIAIFLGKETIFIIGTAPTADGWTVRDFLPSGSEVTFSGTGALAAATVIRDKFLCGVGDSVTLNFPAGPTIVTFDADGNPSFASPPAAFGFTFLGADRAALLACFGLVEGDMVPGLPIQESLTPLPTVIIPITNLAKLEAIDANDPAFIACQTALAGTTGVLGIFEVVSTQVNDPATQAVVRVFAGALGLNEDPISVGPNAALGGYAGANPSLFGAPPVSFVLEQNGALITVSVADDGGDIIASIGGVNFNAAEGTIHVTCTPVTTGGSGAGAGLSRKAAAARSVAAAKKAAATRAAAARR